MSDADDTTRWLVLVYQFPQVPGSLRVKIWRRLQSIGAVSIKNSMYVLPLNEQSQEDFQWLLAELTDGGAEAAILESRFVDGMSDQQVRALFAEARDVDYAALVDEIEATLAALPADLSADDNALRDARRVLTKSASRLAEIEAIDFFGAEGHTAAEGALRALEERVTMPSDGADAAAGSARAKIGELRQRVWVTRRNVRVDRIASAWLIRRWIDADAVFKFVAGKGYTPGPRELRFDMFEAEFGHEGDRCTFEVLAQRFRPDDAALSCIAEIVHDIDLKDGKFGRAETQGIASLLTGIVASADDDDRRIARGSDMLDDLYRYFDREHT